MLCLQGFSYQNLISAYSRAHDLFWFGPWTSLQTFLKEQIIFLRMNDSQNENLLEWNLKYTMQRLKQI